jgi:hypothetical protein
MTTLIPKIDLMNGGSTPTGAVNRAINLKLAETVSVTDFGADPTGVADSATAFNNALAASKAVFVPTGTYKLLSTITLPDYSCLIGAGISNTTVTQYGNNVSFVLKAYCQLEQMTVNKSGSHTKNLIEVGSSSLDGGRAIISNVYVTGAGQDGIQIIQGNLGTLENLASVSNGLNGVRFLAGNANSNSWTMQGYNDLRGNGNNGLNIEGGASLGDALCSKANMITGVVAQNNSNYGVFIGTRSNLVSCYAETNTTADVQLGLYARGNEVKTVNGYVVDSSSNPSYNIVYNYNATGGYQRIFQNQTLFSGVANTGLGIYNDDGTAGYLTLTKTGARAFAFTGQNSSGNFTFAFKSAGGGLITTTFGGNTQPDADNAYNLGAASFRWATVYAATGTINTSDANQKTDIVDISDVEKRVAVKLKSSMKRFKFKDGKRYHFGTIAQDVKSAFESEGLVAEDYGLFCSDTLEDGTVRLGIRYDELFAFIISTL